MGQGQGVRGLGRGGGVRHGNKEGASGGGAMMSSDQWHHQQQPRPTCPILPPALPPPTLTLSCGPSSANGFWNSSWACGGGWVGGSTGRGRRAAGLRRFTAAWLRRERALSSGCMVWWKGVALAPAGVLVLQQQQHYHHHRHPHYRGRRGSMAQTRAWMRASAN